MESEKGLNVEDTKIARKLAIQIIYDHGYAGHNFEPDHKLLTDALNLITKKLPPRYPLG